MKQDPSSQFHELDRLLGLVEARARLADTKLAAHLGALTEKGRQRLLSHGRFGTWYEAVKSIPAGFGESRVLGVSTPSVSSEKPIDFDLDESLLALMPFKKGPFSLFGTTIDAEWRSDWKWTRVQAMATPLAGRRVLDVGTGNGYFLLRAVGDGASFVLGIEPSVLFACQFMAISRCFQVPEMALLPLPGEDFVQGSSAFDTVLSMGVLYHRRSPLDHLSELKGYLRPGGELVLETLVMSGEEGYSLLPRDRYAGMRNVWFIPTLATLEAWLKRLGYVGIELGDPVPTTPNEQRSTAWSGPISLEDFLNPEDPSKTVEGHPSPTRAIVIARRPG